MRTKDWLSVLAGVVLYVLEEKLDAHFRLTMIEWDLLMQRMRSRGRSTRR